MGYFDGIKKIQYEGKDSKSDLAFRYYDADRTVMGKTMAEHFKFAIAYWHTFSNTGGDPFGGGTKAFPWDSASTAEQRAKDKMDAAFEFFDIIGAKYFCFHDFDLIEEGANLTESRKRLDFISDYAVEKMKGTDIKVLWGTANLFSHPRYMNGASTNPDFDVVAYAGAQVRNAIDTTIKVGGENYVFWGGREGYMTVIGFLREFDLLGDFKINVEVNHATLALHSFTHELQVATH